MPELSGATKSSKEKTAAVLGCQEKQLQQTAGENPPCSGPGAGGYLGYHTNTPGTFVQDCPNEPVPAPGPAQRHRGWRGLCRRPAASPGTGSGSFAYLGCTNLLLFLHGTRTGPQCFPRLSRMHKRAAAGRTRNLRASRRFGENSFCVPGSQCSGREVLVCDTCKLEITAPHRQKPRNNKQTLSANL